MTCSAPADCAELERRHSAGVGLLADGGASRGNLLSGEADHVILTVSRMEEEKGANPGYRAFFSNGFNVTRVLVLFVWELTLEWTAALRAIRRDVRQRPSRRHLPAHACGDVRRRARSDRVRRALRHAEGTARDLRDVLELRRGGAPLGPRACRHARGAAEARRAVRADRPRAHVRVASVRDRRALGPRTDAGCDVQAAKRLRARRARRALAHVRTASRTSRAETSSTRSSGSRCRRQPVPTPRRSVRRTTCPTGRSSCSGRGISG